MATEPPPEILSIPCPAVTMVATVARNIGAAGDWGPSLRNFHHGGYIAIVATLGERVGNRSFLLLFCCYQKDAAAHLLSQVPSVTFYDTHRKICGSEYSYPPLHGGTD
ncbi:unnamed protein product [Parnassius mnemosyne]|uniref:Uncharacterized protein n=1 Tax=Parnassius mnemosyne TaxID=213953 RepID=A0AAV1KW12_9NEOP